MAVIVAGTDCHWIRDRSCRERGQIVLLSAIFLPILMGMLGLAIDGGYLMVRRTDAQRAADAAALAGAQYLMANPTADPRQTACDFAKNNGFGSGACPNSEVTVTWPYAGQADKIEVKLAQTKSTFFIRVLDASLSQATVGARAVGSATPASRNYALVVLDPTQCDSFTTSSNITIVGGGMIVNSDASTGGTCTSTREAAKQNGASVISAGTCMSGQSPPQPIPCTLDHNSTAIWTVGSNVTNTPSPSTAPPYPDPLSCGPLPAGGQAHVGEDYCPRPVPCPQSGGPSTCVPRAQCPSPPPAGCRGSDGSANNPRLTQVTGAGETVLQPGTYYGGLKINSTSGIIRFSPGIYVFAGSDHSENKGGFSYNSGSLCGLRQPTDTPTHCPVANEVTFFNTRFEAASDSRDKPCGAIEMLGSGVLKFAAPIVRRSASSVTPQTKAGYLNMLFWQDDSCSAEFKFGGSGSGSTWTNSGVMYLPQAKMVVSGGGNFGSVQILVDQFSQSGGQTININFTRFINTDRQLYKLLE